MIGPREILTTGALTAAFFTMSCSGESGDRQEKPTSPSVSSPSPRKCSSLNAVDLLGPSKSGGENAVNRGECAGIYDPNTLGTIGKIVTQGAFVIQCVDGPKPASLRVEAGGVTGNVNVAESALQRYIDGDFQVSQCPVPNPSAS